MRSLYPISPRGRAHRPLYGAFRARLAQAFHVLVLALASFGVVAPQAHAYETAATAALVYDMTTGARLYEKNADEAMPPASMSKLMTLYLLFDALREGRVTPETVFTVSRKAHLMGGSKMFLREGERVAVRDLLLGIIVQSGNDACVAVAENLAGSEARFVEAMNQKAREIGLLNSTFGNATGWPHPAQRMSPADLVRLAEILITEFPEYYALFARESFTWDNIKQDNRNPLLGVIPGADGLKTGHTSEAGYGLVGSAMRGDRRIIFMITGLPSSAARAQEARRITDWAFTEFDVRALFEANETIARAEVWMGNTGRVELFSPKDIHALYPSGAQQSLSVKVVYNGPVEAPIQKGQHIADLVIDAQGMASVTHPLLAVKDVPRGGILRRVQASAIRLSVTGLNAAIEAIR